MSEQSAGILLFRFKRKKLEILLAHPGGPFFENKDEGVWSIAKGLCEGNESLLETARREFEEETGFTVDGNFIGLGQLRMKSGKIVHVWALEHDIDATKMVSNSFAMEWPRNSGQIKEFPEMDTAAWFSLVEVRSKIAKGQAAFIDRLVSSIDYTDPME